METTDSSGDAPAEKYWRADDVVAKAFMDELTRSWHVDENGQIDECPTTDTWTVDRLGGGDAMDRRARARDHGESTGQPARARCGRGHET